LIAIDALLYNQKSLLGETKEKKRFLPFSFCARSTIAVVRISL